MVQEPKQGSGRRSSLPLSERAGPKLFKTGRGPRTRAGGRTAVQPAPQRARWGLSCLMRGAAQQLICLGSGRKAFQRARWAPSFAVRGAAQQRHRSCHAWQKTASFWGRGTRPPGIACRTPRCNGAFKALAREAFTAHLPRELHLAERANEVPGRKRQHEGAYPSASALGP